MITNESRNTNNGLAGKVAFKIPVDDPWLISFDTSRIKSYIDHQIFRPVLFYLESSKLMITEGI